jgi:hypothetical protein
MNLSINVGSMKLYNGRRSYSAHTLIGGRSIALYRWDTARTPLAARPFPGTINRWMLTIWRGRLMTWYVAGWKIAQGRP